MPDNKEISYILCFDKNNRPMGHIAHLRNTVQINKHNVD